jgi:hypothetical protein
VDEEDGCVDDEQGSPRRNELRRQQVVPLCSDGEAKGWDRIRPGEKWWRADVESLHSPTLASGPPIGEEMWTCGVCTLSNHFTRTTCLLCYSQISEGNFSGRRQKWEEGGKSDSE